MKSRALISLYQLSLGFLESIITVYTDSYMLTVWQTGDLYICVSLAHLINLGRADMATSAMCIKGLRDQPSRYLEFDRRNEGSVSVVQINYC